MPLVHARALKNSDAEEAFELGSMISQIFCGVAFTALSLYLVFSNTTRLSYIHRASIEKRLAVCCQLSLIVAALSAFLNFFQLTELDNWALPGQRQFTVDISRPVEWVLTCPVMQLSLVIMGGPRIPDIRRVIMPLSSLIVLSLGGLTLFLDKPYTFIVYGCGFSIHCGAMYLNRLQIIEHSRGVEGLFSGDSEFRRATLILMLTWIPFPMWFILSPEGISLIENITIIQLGWAFLNIISKFTLIFYIQRIKDNYNIRLKVKRTLEQRKGNGTSWIAGKDEVDFTMPETNNELGALVLETMTFLGMAQNADRLLKLLALAKISNVSQLGLLQQKDCEEKQLPYDLICAIQNRYRIWALEMVDDAELGLEAGEKFYNIGLESNDKILEIVPRGVDKAIVEESRADYDDYKISYPKSLNGQIPGHNISPREGDHTPRRRPDSAHRRGRPDLITSCPPLWSSERNEQQSLPDMLKETVKDTVMETMTNVMEQFESKLLEKIEYSLEGAGRKVAEGVDKALEGVGRHVADCDTTIRFGLQDVGKSMERSQAMLESKCEYVFAAQKSQHLDELKTNVKIQFEDLSQKNMQNATQFENKVMSAMESRFEPIEAALLENSKTLSQLLEMQKVDVARLGGSLTELTEGCAHQVIQESKAAAYTIQAKMAVLEETQKKASFESEERIANKMLQFERSVSEKVKDAINGSQVGSAPQSMQKIPDHVNMGNFSEKFGFVDSDATGRTLEALRTLENNLIELIKGSSSEQSKQLELGLGVFGSALRAQLDSMQHSHASLQKETEAKIESKLDRMQEQGKKQTDKVLTQLTLHQASGLQGPISSSYKPSGGGSSGGNSRRQSNPWNEV